MVYQHELNHMMYQYFNQTNQAMREFAEENTQLIAALSQEHDLNRQLQLENNQLIAALSQEHDKTKLIKGENEPVKNEPVSKDECILLSKRCRDAEAKLKQLTFYYTGTIQHLNSNQTENLYKMNALQLECDERVKALQKYHTNELDAIRKRHKEELDDYKEAHANLYKDKQLLKTAINTRNDKLDDLSRENTSLNDEMTSLIEQISTITGLDTVYPDEWEARQFNHDFKDTFKERCIQTIQQCTDKLKDTTKKTTDEYSQDDDSEYREYLSTTQATTYEEPEDTSDWNILSSPFQDTIYGDGTQPVYRSLAPPRLPVHVEPSCFNDGKDC